MSDLATTFNDPFDPARSLQLNNRYWPNDTFRHLDALREAEYDLEHRRLSSLRKSLKPVKALLPAQYHRAFLSRLVYSMVYRVYFEPIRFNVKLSPEFIEENTYRGTEPAFSWPARRTEELKYIRDMVHGIYRDHYGIDVISSDYAIRYSSCNNTKAVSLLTAHGEFSDFHLDEGKDFTCVVYVSDVQPENGCFTYIDGTHRIPKSHILRALHTVAEIQMGLGSATPEQVTSVPLEVRGCIGIGNTLDDAKREKLRASKVEVVGPPGSGVIFNGFDTLHRGGKVQVGSRTALFMSTKGHVNKRVKKAMYDQMAYLWL
jgi:hypothetical protein